MSIPNLNNQIPLVQYNASSGQTEFSIAFYIFDLNDVLVYVNNVLKTIVVDYAIKKNDGTAISSTDLPLDGAKLVFNTGQTEGAKISINRDIPISRFTQFTTGGAFFADAFNTELTRILAIQQQLSRDINRSLRLSPSDAEGGSLEMPTGRANTILAFNSLGNLILTKLADIDKANVSSFIATLLDDTTAQAARTTLDAQQLNANLSALANLTGASNKLPYFTGAGAMAVRDLLATTTTQGIVYLNNPVTVANNATTPNTDLDFTAGNFAFSDGSGQAISTAITKRLQSSGSWSAGASGNLLTTGARLNSSTYHLYAIYNPTTLAVDYMALLGVAGTAPDPTASLPSGYTKFKRIASILTDGSGNIRAFTQRGFSFELTTPVVNLDATASNGTTLESIQTPAGIAVKAGVTLGIDLASGSTVGNYYVSLQNANQNYTPSAGGARSYSLNVGKSSGTLVSSGEFYKYTNTSSQIRVTQAGAGTLCSISLTTNGWEDYQLLN